MRVLLGWLVLCGFVAALAWFSAEKLEGSSEQVSDEGPGVPGLPARVVIGIPSGAEPFCFSALTHARAATKPQSMSQPRRTRT